MNDDARLISAAPDLLTTAINHLEQLIEYAQYGPSDCGEICDCNRDKKGRCWFWDTWELKKAIETAAGKEVFDA